MSIYRVHFKWKGKDVVLCAKSLDLTHPYFVSIKDLIFPSQSSVIINPSEDDLKRAFSDTDHLMIPFQTVSLIEELAEAERVRLVPFSLVERSSQAEVKEPDGADPDDAAATRIPESGRSESEAEQW